MMALKAYAVTEKDENTGAIYFAKHRIAAAKAGANEFGDGELGYVSCRRAKWADAYAGKGLPAKVCIENGWHFECHGCGMRLDEDMPYEHRLPISGVIGSQHGSVFCCARCKWRDMRNRAKRKALEQEAIETLKAIVLKRFPGVAFADDKDQFSGHHAYITHERGGAVWRQVAVGFYFPGMKIGAAHFRLDDSQGRFPGPRKAYYTCCNGDREAFEAYAAATRRTS